MTYRYAEIFVHALRPGDQIKAADGTTWLTPIREQGITREHASKRWGASWIYKIWTDTRPGFGGPDHTMYGHNKVRIRRPLR